MSDTKRTETDRLEQPDQDTPVTPENHDAEDVPRVVKDHDGDGPGSEDPGPSDFQGFAETDVQEEDK